jgi:hypothetical protein
MAGVTLVSGLCRSCRGHAPFDKASVRGFSSSSPARSFDDEVTSQLLAQPALRLKPASSAGCRRDPWDVSRQMALPLAYPDSHPHDTRAPPTSLVHRPTPGHRPPPLYPTWPPEGLCRIEITPPLHAVMLRSFRIRSDAFYFHNISWIGDSGGHRDHVRVQVCGGAARVAPELLL